MKCCICTKPIKKTGSWDKGHNASPILDGGRCCDECNSVFVIPVRIKLITAYEMGVKAGKEKVSV
jgi:hypothetical protein